MGEIISFGLRKLKQYLLVKGLWKYVDTDFQLVKGSDEIQKMSMCRAVILCSIESKYVPIVAMKSGPKEMWETLKETHKSKCVASKHTMRRKLNFIKMGRNESIRDLQIESAQLKTNYHLRDTSYPKKISALHF